MPIMCLLHSSKPYELESMWDPLRYDVYLLNLTTGKKQTIVKQIRDRVEVSPGSKYLVWFDYSDYSYYTYHIDSGKKYRISKPSIIRADLETNTTFDYNAPYGSAGWLADDRAILIYDRYDIWKVDPENRKTPKNLTINGRKDKTVHRLLRLDKKNALDEKESQYLIAPMKSPVRWAITAGA